MSSIELEYDRHPVVVWEVTRACGLHCQHCPMGAEPQRRPLELSTYEGYKTIDQIATLEPARFVISGGDPLEREDIFQFIEYAKRRGIEPVVALSPTSELTQQAMTSIARKGAGWLYRKLRHGPGISHFYMPADRAREITPQSEIHDTSASESTRTTSPATPTC